MVCFCMRNSIASTEQKRVEMKALLENRLVMQAVRFLLGGGATTALHYSLLLTLTEGLGWFYWQAATVAFFPTFALGFEIQRRWVFKNPDSIVRNRQLRHFAAKWAILYPIGLVAVDQIAHALAIWYFPVQIMYAGAMTAVSFVISKWIFREETSDT